MKTWLDLKIGDPIYIIKRYYNPLRFTFIESKCMGFNNDGCCVFYSDDTQDDKMSYFTMLLRDTDKKRYIDHNYDDNEIFICDPEELKLLLDEYTEEVNKELEQIDLTLRQIKDIKDNVLKNKTV